mgnify:CR=1 FL=1
MEYIYKGSDLWNNGFYFELNGFERRVYTDIKEVEDTNGDYYNTYLELNGNGINSIEEYILNRKLAPVYNSFFELFEDEELKNSIESMVSKPGKTKSNISDLEKFKSKLSLFISEYSKQINIAESSKIIETIFSDFGTIEKLNNLIISKSFSKKMCSKFGEYFIFSKTNEYYSIIWRGYF